MAQVAEQPEAQQAVLGSGDACEDQETLAASLGVDDSSIQQPMDASAGPSTALAAQSSDADEAAPVSAPLGEQEVAEQHVGEPTGMETCKTEPVQPAAGEHLQDSKQQEVLQEAATDNATVTPVEAAAAATGLPAETDAAVDDAAVPSAVDGADPEQVTSSSSVTDVPSHAEAADAAGAAAEGSMQGIVQEAAAAPQLDPPTEAAAAAQPDDAPAATEAVPPAATAAGSDAAVTAEAQQAAAAEVQQAGVADAPAAMLDQEAAAAPSHSRQPNKAYFVDGVRAVDVEVDCGPSLPCKLLHVTMDVSALETSTKPYMGGFKHKHAGTVYHHASIQTAQGQGQHRNGHKQRSGVQQDVADAGEKLTRETQTIKETSCSCQTVREAATQMVAPGLLLDCSGDRVLTPRPYLTAEVVQQHRDAAALTIQRFSRGWFARKRAGVLRGIKSERDAFLAETAADSAQAAFDHKRREVERRTHPLSKADFVLLEAELESWRQQQTAAIKNAGLVQQEEKAALQLLLAKETRLLHTLDRLRVAAHQERRVTGRQKTLGALAQPKTWALSNGGKVLVHTPLTVRAAELQQLYRGLTLATLSLDERLDVLLHVKWVAKEWDNTVTRELVGLIDREADLLNRGRSPKTLDGLRKRIAGLFLTCCQHPAFNPEAARLRVNAVGPNGPEAFEYVLEQQAAA